MKVSGLASTTFRPAMRVVAVSARQRRLLTTAPLARPVGRWPETPRCAAWTGTRFPDCQPTTRVRPDRPAPALRSAPLVLAALLLLAAALAASPPASSASCLPFLTTSGSAGDAAAATASGSGATSSLITVTCATVASSSVMNLNLPSCGRSETRTTSCSFSPVTSSEDVCRDVRRQALDLHLAQHLIQQAALGLDADRMPSRWIGTSTIIALSIAMRFRSMCSSLPLMARTASPRSSPWPRALADRNVEDRVVAGVRMQNAKDLLGIELDRD